MKKILLLISLFLYTGLYANYQDDIKKKFQEGNYKEGMELMAKACNYRKLEVCYELGTLLIDKRVVATPDVDQANYFFGKACDGGIGLAIGCYQQGRIYSFKKDNKMADKSFAKANQISKEACRKGDGEGCHLLGSMTLAGQGVKADGKKALEYYVKSCNSGFVQGCYAVGTMYMVGKNIKLDYKKADTYLKKACNGGISQACYGVGVLYEKGMGISKDENRALIFYKKACDGGYTEACSTLQLKKQSSKTETVHNAVLTE